MHSGGSWPFARPQSLVTTALQTGIGRQQASPVPSRLRQRHSKPLARWDGSTFSHWGLELLFGDFCRKWLPHAELAMAVQNDHKGLGLYYTTWQAVQEERRTRHRERERERRRAAAQRKATAAQAEAAAAEAEVAQAVAAATSAARCVPNHLDARGHLHGDHVGQEPEDLILGSSSRQKDAQAYQGHGPVCWPEVLNVLTTNCKRQVPVGSACRRCSGL